MASIKEIRTHIKSVEQTLKITNAMYLISSSNLRKARKQLNDVYPYFKKIYSTISDILHHSPDLHHPYFDQRLNIPQRERKIGYIIVTGDKGLAGSYNHNVLKLAQEQMSATDHPRLFVVGQVGRVYFAERGIPIEEEFAYSAQNPSTYRSRLISDEMIRLFQAGELDEVHIIYTELVNALKLEVKEVKLLPLARDNFSWEPKKTDFIKLVNYLPTERAVLNSITPGFVKGMVLGALVESYSAEQSARMTAMESSSDNAREMLKQLSLTYNRARQAAITQEITEIAGGAQASLM